MQKVDLLKDENIIEWLDAKGKADNTRNSYIQGLYFYTELIGKTPDELLEEAKTEQRSGIMMMDRKILRYLNKYLSFLQKRKLAPKTIHSYIGGVRSFYRKQYIEVPDLDLKKAKPTNRYKKVPTKEVLQEVLNACDFLEKALILTGVSSGLSDVDIVNLKISDFKNGYDPINKITILRLTRHKLGETGEDFVTFLSPEATKAINNYLTNHRNRDPKTHFQRDRDRLEKQKIVNDNGYLFIRKHVPTSYLTTKNEEERKITPSNLVQIYRGISESAKMNTPYGDWNVIRSHNMRKYFYNVLIANKCQYLHAEYMMGHTLDTTRDAYFLPTEEQVKQSYIECVPYLTIQKELDVSVSSEFQKAIERAEKAEAEVARVSVERDDFQRLKTEYDQKMIDLEKSVRHELHAQLRVFDKLKHTAPENERERYAKEAQKVRDKLHK